MQFNTAIAKMIEFVNEFTKLDVYPKRVLIMAVQALMPFAPHLAEEAWEMLGRQEPLSYYPWREVDHRYLKEDQVTYVIQVNSKIRGCVVMPKGLNEEEILNLAKKDPNVSGFINGKELKTVIFVIFVPDKLLNLAV